MNAAEMRRDARKKIGQQTADGTDPDPIVLCLL